MPKSLLENSFDKATNENNTTEDWSTIFEIVDQINQTNSEKEAIKLFIKKLNDKDPHVVKNTLSLLDACISNCDRKLKLEICSRSFIEELRDFVLKEKYPKLSKQMALLIEKWQMEKEFKCDPALDLLPTLYCELKKSGVNFQNEIMPDKKIMKIDSNIEKKEEEELERAIKLSLKEASSSAINKKQQSNSSNSLLYGSLTQKKPVQSLSKLDRQVKALYDFEAAEDNEITFKAGDLLILTDDSDVNWWKGFTSNGIEGLFPSNFVTFDLSENIENGYSLDKKTSFDDNTNRKVSENDAKTLKVYINENKIDKCINILQNADPTGEIQTDSQEILVLEEECYMMGPLIDENLQLIDKKHTQLEDLNLKILEAFQMYNNLMKESITKTNNFIINSNSLSNLNESINLTKMNFALCTPSIDPNSIHLANQLNSLNLNALETVESSSVQGLPSLVQMQPQIQMGPKYQTQPSSTDSFLPNQISSNMYQTNNLQSIGLQNGNSNTGSNINTYTNQFKN